MGNPGNYLSSRETACFENCAKRFLETTQLIMQVPSSLFAHAIPGDAVMDGNTLLLGLPHLPL